MDTDEKKMRFVLDRVVDTVKDIERPHYEFLLGDKRYFLPLDEQLDSGSYRDTLTNKLNSALRSDYQLKAFVSSVESKYEGLSLGDLKVGSPERQLYHKDTLALDEKIHSLMVSTQFNYNENLYATRMLRDYGQSTDLLELDSVDMERNTVRVRLNYYQEFPDSENGFSRRGPMVDIPMQEDREDTVRLLVALKEQGLVQSLAKDFMRVQYVVHRNYHKDIMLSGNDYLDSFRDIVNSVNLRQRKEFDEAFQKSLEKLLLDARKQCEETKKQLEDVQKVRDKRFFGLGYYLDRTVGRKSFLERKKHHTKMEVSIRNLDERMYENKWPSQEFKVMSGALAAAETKYSLDRKIHKYEEEKLSNEERLEVVFEKPKSRTRDRGSRSL